MNGSPANAAFKFATAPRIIFGEGKLAEAPATIEGFGQLLEGAGDDYPENSFYMVGGLKEALSKK